LFFLVSCYLSFFLPFLSPLVIFTFPHLVSVLKWSDNGAFFPEL
jgi:hypothetical protein